MLFSILEILVLLILMTIMLWYILYWNSTGFIKRLYIVAYCYTAENIKINEKILKYWMKLFFIVSITLLVVTLIPNIIALVYMIINAHKGFQYIQYNWLLMWLSPLGILSFFVPGCALISRISHFYKKNDNLTLLDDLITNSDYTEKQLDLSKPSTIDCQIKHSLFKKPVNTLSIVNKTKHNINKAYLNFVLPYKHCCTLWKGENLTIDYANVNESFKTYNFN
ncbi:hypothetical protein [Mycoplasmopsis felifaucium]|uniref:hypothetical protein n=1 Tax=Mycoplasmopsis felifaucium TaxID=35768 RepID=UPI000481466E|nr:hypothetical protein [Mycoplasmopsis felifaucium]